MTETIAISVRLSPEESAWLALRKKENRSSVNLEIINAIRAAMIADPLTIFVHECAIPGETFFTASVGKHGDDFYEGPDRTAAFVAARAKAKELGLSVAAIKFATENFAVETAHV